MENTEKDEQKFQKTNVGSFKNKTFKFGNKDKNTKKSNFGKKPSIFKNFRICDFFPKLVKNLEFEVLKLIFEKVGNIFGSFEMVKKGKDGI